LSYYILVHLHCAGYPAVPRMRVPLDLVNEDGHTITVVVRVWLRLNQHLYLRCNIVDLWHIVDVVVCRFASDFIEIVVFRMGYPEP